MNGPPGTVYAIVNGRLRADPKETRDDLLHIGIRSLDLFADGLQFASLRAVAQTVVSHHPAYQFRYVTAPADLRDEATPNPFNGMFDPKLMRKLFIAGEDLGRRGAAAWNAGILPDDGETHLIQDNHLGIRRLDPNAAALQ